MSLIAHSTQILWNNGRLAPSFAILSGYHPYYPRESGPILDTIYTPLTYLFYLPCGIFFQHVSLAIITGSILSFFAFIAPLAIIAHRFRTATVDREMIWIITLILLQVIAYQTLSWSVFVIHADAPSILFAALCVLFLDNRGEPVSGRNLLLSVICGTASAWSKQTMAPILVLPVATAFFQNPAGRSWIKLCGSIVVLNAGLFLAFSACWGMDAMIENVWRIPSHHAINYATFNGIDRDSIAPTAGAKITSEIVQIDVIAGKYLSPYILLIFLFSVASRFAMAPAGFSLRIPRLAMLLLWAALISLPGAAAAEIKEAGYVNDECPFAWFLFLAFFTIIMGERQSRQPDSPPVLTPGRIIRPVLLGIGIIGLIHTTAHFRENFKWITTAFQNANETAVDVSRRFPGQYFFPQHPLTGFIVDKKFYHYDAGIYERQVAGRGPTPDHYSAYIPSTATVWAWPKGFPIGYSTLPHLPGFRATNGPPGTAEDQFEWYTFNHTP
ncbi:MAG TPA: hypothetical protein VN625_06165 [Desulfuromonadaceae bacterium]|nr:hypothetical protein [Desulfuromonadaceae bacterium]